MLTTEELFRIGSEAYPDGVWLKCKAMMLNAIAAHTAKLLADVEMPEYKYIDRHDVPKEGMCVYTQDQLQQYAAAAAAQARMKALDEAKAVCVASELIDLPTTVEIAAVHKCAAAIESLKGKP